MVNTTALRADPEGAPDQCLKVGDRAAWIRAKRGRIRLLCRLCVFGRSLSLVHLRLRGQMTTTSARLPVLNRRVNSPARRFTPSADTFPDTFRTAERLVWDRPDASAAVSNAAAWAPPNTKRSYEYGCGRRWTRLLRF